ncbi:MAG: tetratricopeptide (TPR) repeat protein [Saprospiraceae bacterium]|jgi:tetratricopeptide (TPR) repeat protein
MQKNRIDTLLKFLEDDPGDSFIKFAIAKEYEKMGTLKRALDTYIELRKMDPEYVGLYYHLAALQIELSQPDEALKTYDEGIDIAKKAADFHALSELHTAKLNLDLD